MNQGPAALESPLDSAVTSAFAAALGLDDSDIAPELPARVVSTGLPYLIFPVTTPGLARSSMARAADLNAMLADVGAEFVYVVDPEAPEGRTWDRSGLTEDVATGSAAGPAAAYLFEHGLRSRDAVVEMNQGGFVGRPSVISVREAANGDLWVGGEVAAFASGVIRDGLVAGRPEAAGPY
jgi:PhzF family phenazine biosynthesis protein